MKKINNIKRAIAAHNGLTAKIVSDMDFDYVWASSLEISASFGLPDASIVSFETIKNVVANMVHNSSKPVIVDCDSGYGNTINVYYALHELKKIGVKAVCLEDNIFPKQNSFYKGSRSLETAESFAKKIEVAKSIFNEKDTIVIARTEALIQAMGAKEALRRATLYEQAGADMIMPHSKQKTPDELFDFAKKWKGKIPLVSVPSTYYDVTIDELAENKVVLAIYANHTVRAIKKALEEILPAILKDGSSRNIESRISPIKEILSLTGEEQIKNLEKQYAL